MTSKHTPVHAADPFPAPQGLKPQGPRRTAPLPLADLLPARSSKAAPAAGPTTSTAASTEPTTPRDSDDAADDDLVSSLLLDLSNAAAAAGGKGEGAPGRARALRVGGKLIRKTVDRPLMRRVVERADLAGRVQDWDISTRVQVRLFWYGRLQAAAHDA